MFPKKQSIGGMISSGTDSDGPPKYKSATDPATPDPPSEPTPSGSSEQLVSDAIAPLVAAGMDETEAKGVLASMFEAMGKCLRGGGEQGPAEGGPV